jgi:hypothetical protein
MATRRRDGLRGRLPAVYELGAAAATNVLPKQTNGPSPILEMAGRRGRDACGGPERFSCWRER